MKKIFLSILFLLLMSISSNSFAAASGTCVGPTVACVDFVASETLCKAANCTFTAASGTTAATCTGTAKLCSSFTESVGCKARNCSWSTNADANNNAFVDTLCNALRIVTGSGGKAFAAFAIISVGIGFFTGKVSWGLMIGITAGIAAMFGAPTIVAAISGGSALDCGA